MQSNKNIDFRKSPENSKAWGRIDTANVPDFILRAIKPAHIGRRCFVRNQAQSYLLAFDEPLQVGAKTPRTPLDAHTLPRPGEQVSDFRRYQHGTRYWITFDNRLQRKEPAFGNPLSNLTSN